MRKKVAVLTGAGISAESGLLTFRGEGGLCEKYDFTVVATPAGWEKDKKLVLDFYNMRRQEVMKAMPNAAHTAIAELEKYHDVCVLTQNIDDLHERAGSKNILHIHGEIMKSRSTGTGKLYLVTSNIEAGDVCENGYQLRPHVVWFGEEILFHEEAKNVVQEADAILVIGTSLNVYPFNTFLKKAQHKAVKIYINKDKPDKIPYGYQFLSGNSSELVPMICRKLSDDLL